MTCTASFYVQDPAASSTVRSSSAGFDADERAFLGRLLAWAFAVRVLAVFLLAGSGYSLRFAPDAETYATAGWQMALYWAGEVWVKPWRFTTNQPLGYFYINAMYFYVFGHTEIPLRLTNAALGTISGRYVYLTGRDLFGVAVARRTSMLYLFFPSMILWSALNIRDIWVVSLILFISWKSLEVVRGYSHAALGSLLAATFALTFFRDYLFFVVALPPVIAVLIGHRSHLARNFVLGLLGGLGLLLLVEQGSAGHSALSRMSLEALSQTRQDMAYGAASAFEENVDISTPGRALAFLPQGLAYYLFSPFPWQITSLLKFFALPEMLLIYYLTPAMFRGIRFTLRHRFREALQILLLTSLLTLSYALGEGNVGTLYRHRAQAIAFYLLFAAVGLELKRARAVERAAA